MQYNAKVVLEFWRALWLPAAQPEFKFHPDRQWRFDFAFASYELRVTSDKQNKKAANSSLITHHSSLAIEVQGGIWTRGRHTRGAALKLEWEKLNTAAILGWRILYCEPREILTVKFAETILEALKT
jgi:hypothetical protein